MSRALIALGSNLGDRAQTLRRAVTLLSEHPSIRVIAQSAWSHTDPVGGPVGQDEFLNGAAQLETTLDPPALLHVLQQTETQLGRRRLERWGPRTLDLDLLLFDDLCLAAPELEIPHPGLEYRRFVLEPAVEIAADWRHPRLGWTLRQLLDHLNESPPHVALVGDDPAQVLRVAQAVAAKWSARLVQGLSLATGAARADERLLCASSSTEWFVHAVGGASTRFRLVVMLESLDDRIDAMVANEVRRNRLAVLQRVNPGPVARIPTRRGAEDDASIIHELLATLAAI